MFLGWFAVELWISGKGPKRIDAFIYDRTRMVGHLVLKPGRLFKRRLVRAELKALMQQPINYSEAELKAWEPITTRPPKTLWDDPAMRRRWRAQSERPASNYLFYEGSFADRPKAGQRTSADGPLTGIEFACGLKDRLRVVLLWKECPGFGADEPFQFYYRDWQRVVGRVPSFRKRPHWRMLGSYRQSQVIDADGGRGWRMCEGWG